MLKLPLFQSPSFSMTPPPPSMSVFHPHSDLKKGPYVTQPFLDRKVTKNSLGSRVEKMEVTTAEAQKLVVPTGFLECNEQRDNTEPSISSWTQLKRANVGYFIVKVTFSIDKSHSMIFWTICNPTRGGTTATRAWKKGESIWKKEFNKKYFDVWRSKIRWKLILLR